MASTPGQRRYGQTSASVLEALSRRVVVHFLVLFLLGVGCTSYRTGDAVGLLIKADYQNIDGLRSQMPIFGVPSSALVKDIGMSRRISLSFAEGSRSTPWFDLVDMRMRSLRMLTVTFVYSKSGGDIHSVTAKEEYSESADAMGQHRNGQFRLQYNWVEEADVDPAGGATVVFILSLIVSVLILVHACGRIESEDNGSGARSVNDHLSGSDGYPGYADQVSAVAGASVPKWE